MQSTTGATNPILDELGCGDHLNEHEAVLGVTCGGVGRVEIHLDHHRTKDKALMVGISRSGWGAYDAVFWRFNEGNFDYMDRWCGLDRGALLEVVGEVTGVILAPLNNREVEEEEANQTGSIAI